MFFSVPATNGIILECKPLILLFSGENFLNSIPTMMIRAPLIFIALFSIFFGNIILIPFEKEKNNASITDNCLCFKHSS